MYKNGLLKNVMPILEIYMDVLMRNWKSIAMYDIEINDDFPDVWEKYLEKHRYEIAQYLKNIIQQIFVWQQCKMIKRNLNVP